MKAMRRPTRINLPWLRDRSEETHARLLASVDEVIARCEETIRDLQRLRTEVEERNTTYSMRHDEGLSYTLGDKAFSFCSNFNNNFGTSVHSLQHMAALYTAEVEVLHALERQRLQSDIFIAEESVDMAEMGAINAFLAAEQNARDVAQSKRCCYDGVSAGRAGLQRCTRGGTVQVDGKLYCKTHAPKAKGGGQ